MPSLFEGLGFRHVGPVDGHDIDALVETLTRLRDDQSHQPVLLHVVTEKGHGHPLRSPDKEKYHAVSKFDPGTLEFANAKANAPTFMQVFASSLIEHARNDEKIAIGKGRIVIEGMDVAILFSAHVLHHLANHDLLRQTRFRALTLPDRFIAHGSPADQYADAGLDSAGIPREILSLRSSMRIPAFMRHARSSIAHTH